MAFKAEISESNKEQNKTPGCIITVQVNIKIRGKKG